MNFLHSILRDEMTDKTNQKMLNQAIKRMKSQRYNQAIRLFYKIIKNKPNFELEVLAYLGLGDALRYVYELELAELMYKKALVRARINENMQLVHVIQDKIENNYVMKKDREIRPVQIEFFMRMYHLQAGYLYLKRMT